MELAPVDRVEILIVVDNATDVLSSTPPHVESEMAGLMRRGARIMAGKCFCCAAHGLSCLITAYRGAASHTVLFDSGPEEYAFERNVTRVGADLGQVKSIVLSHGHFDHAGAMLLALSMIRARHGAQKIPFYAHPGMFRSRAVKMPNGTLLRLEDIPSVSDLNAFGAEVVATTQPQVIHGGMFCVSGEITRVTPYECGFPGQMCLMEDGQSWEPDELMMDERFLAVNVASKGLVVFSACSHAGIVNVLLHAQKSFPGVPLHAVMGGLHLSGSNESVIEQTVEDLRRFDLKTIAAGHCTGWRALAALTSTFGDKILAPAAVGKRYVF